MDRKAYDSLVRSVEEKIPTAGPGQAEYYRGYLRGIKVHFQKSLEGREKNPARSSRGTPPPFHGDTHLDPYPRGYRDGCMGAKPEEAP
jgi:hypothetical protein